MTFGGLRGRTLLAVFGVSAVALLLAAVLIAMPMRAQLIMAIERNLIAETRLAAALLRERQTDGSVAALDREADEIGGFTAARVTLIAADGRVVGDSAEDLAALETLDNHGTRPEVIAARQTGMGVVRRFSATLETDLLYVALTVAHPHVEIVRLALPLTDVDAQFRAVRRSLLVALAVALGCALGLAWLSSVLLARRVDAIAAVARRYAAGDFSAPARDQGGDELGTVARVLDDTARELGRRMRELSLDRARMEAILAGMLEGVVVVNPDGRVMLANDAARRMAQPDGLVPGGHYTDGVRHPDIGAMLGRALAGQTPDGIEFSPLRDPNRTVVARAAPVTTEGAPGAVLVLHDITDLRHADRMRRDFVANVSHELRTPLTAIQGYVEALQDDVPPEPEEAARFLEIIARQANRMERLVRDLLRLARLEAGQEPVASSQTDVETLFADVTTELEGALEAKGQRVVTDIEPAARTLRVDTAKLHDALRNLVENAIAYAPPSTTITLASRRAGGAFVLTVGDEGPGIPEADLSRIFERFYRVDKARSRESGGTGLGLSIVKHLVEILGGDVKAENRKAGGALFSVTLPVR
ncbi:MAG: ATP-binding protein [Vicinamibacterales bacterium]|jgi:two-component system phosphate regulon sensor histidine kinase PhoR|nr:ATP-binding protein [Vicinamibacterales bacterium]